MNALTIEQLFDSVAIRINGPKAWNEQVVIDWNFTDLGRSHRTKLSNGVLIQGVVTEHESADLTLTLTKRQLLLMLAGAGIDGIETQGDLATIERLLTVLDTPTQGFAIRHTLIHALVTSQTPSSAGNRPERIASVNAW